MNLKNLFANVVNIDVKFRYCICINGHPFRNVGAVGGGQYHPETTCPECGVSGGVVTTKEEWIKLKERSD